jgi:hypothetical protein
MKSTSPTLPFQSLADRLALFAGVAAICVAVGYANSASRVSDDPSQRLNAADIRQLAPPAMKDGRWMFAGSELTTKTSTLSTSRLDAELQRIEQTHDTSVANVDATDFIELATAYGMLATREDDTTIYRLDEPQRRLRLIVRHDETTTKLVVAALATTIDGEHWQVHSLASASGNTSNNQHLLPLPSAATSSARRVGDDGQLQMEIVTVPAAKSQLLNDWQAAGWSVQHSDWGSKDSFSFLCVKNNQLVYAWAIGDSNQLILSKTADLQVDNRG